MSFISSKLSMSQPVSLSSDPALFRTFSLTSSGSPSVTIHPVQTLWARGSRSALSSSFLTLSM